jgi:hypothetical protein
MNNEYRIFNATPIQKRIEELKESLATSEAHNDKIRAGIETFEIKQLEWCLSQSTPLIPEIEKAWEDGRNGTALVGNFPFVETKYVNKTSKDYISNLKLDI